MHSLLRLRPRRQRPLPGRLLRRELPEAYVRPPPALRPGPGRGDARGGGRLQHAGVPRPLGGGDRGRRRGGAGGGGGGEHDGRFQVGGWVRDLAINFFSD